MKKTTYYRVFYKIEDDKYLFFTSTRKYKVRKFIENKLLTEGLNLVCYVELLQTIKGKLKFSFKNNRHMFYMNKNSLWFNNSIKVENVPGWLNNWGNHLEHRKLKRKAS